MTQTVKAETKYESYRYFNENSRWEVVSDNGVRLGEIWKGTGGDRKTVWMIHPENFPDSFPDPAVISGYARTTKKNSIAFLEEWHANKENDLVIDGYHLHCSSKNPSRITYYVVPPNPKSWFIVTLTHDPVTQGLSLAGWHGHTTCRGFRLFMSAGASSKEVVHAVIQEITRKITPTEAAVEKMFAARSSMIHQEIIRLYGSLVDPEDPSSFFLCPIAVEQPDGSYTTGPFLGTRLYEITQTSPSSWSLRTRSNSMEMFSGPFERVLKKAGIARVITQQELEKYKSRM